MSYDAEWKVRVFSKGLSAKFRGFLLREKLVEKNHGTYAVNTRTLEVSSFRKMVKNAERFEDLMYCWTCALARPHKETVKRELMVVGVLKERRSSLKPAEEARVWRILPEDYEWKLSPEAVKVLKKTIARKDRERIDEKQVLSL